MKLISNMEKQDEIRISDINVGASLLEKGEGADGRLLFSLKGGVNSTLYVHVNAIRVVNNDHEEGPYLMKDVIGAFKTDCKLGTAYENSLIIYIYSSINPTCCSRYIDIYIYFNTIFIFLQEILLLLLIYKVMN